MNEFIKHENNYAEAWVCVCGNTPSDAGFFPINEDGQEVEPAPEDWTTNQYFCNSCGRVIDQDTLEVVKRLDVTAIIRLD